LEIFNPDLDPEKIFPGDKLVIKPVNPVLDVVIELENTVVESIPFKIEHKKDNHLYKNQKKFIQEGIEGQKEVRYNITLLNGYQSHLKVKNEKTLKEPVNAIVQIGTRTTVFKGGRVNYGVVSGKRISSLYGFRIHPITGRRRFHDGLDIAAAYGNGVYAYTGGRVVERGWNGGYGNCIVIDHGNGLKTRYAHLSKIYGRIGQKVGTGDKIGAVGSSGSSTGPHLHFEVIKNGRTKNPLNYL
jgi:murein DD-endopeptidase MepM/ murein hydrolase activator NlpD